MQMKNLSSRNATHKWNDEHTDISLPRAYFLSEQCADFFML